jgi:hypothetical protein
MPDLILIVSLAGLYAVTMTALHLNDAAHHKLARERWREYNRVLKAAAEENAYLRSEVLRLRKLTRDDMSEVAEILGRVQN